jgi:hypothetical protein
MFTCVEKNVDNRALTGASAEIIVRMLVNRNLHPDKKEARRGTIDYV